MKSQRIVFALVLALFACCAGADKPKPGIYTWNNPDSERDSDITLSTRGKNFQVEGTMFFSNSEAKLTGTLYSSNWKFKGNLSYKDRDGKMAQRPINGYWSLYSNDLEIYPGVGSAKFTREGTKWKESAPSYTGDWDSSFGKMHLTQNGTHVSGKYDYYSGTVDGDIKADGQLYFKWTQSNPDKHGTGFFKLASDGNSFSGGWDYTNASGAALNNGGGWSGRRIK